MGRILVFLTLAGLTAVFVIIYNARYEPVQSAVTSNSNASAQGNTRRTKPTQLDLKQRSPSSRTTSEKEKKYPSKATAIRTEDKGTSLADRDPVEAGGEPEMSVKTDSTPVYSANSKRSKVLRRLRKGEKVQPDLEVIDSEGRWRLVKAPGKGKPGFVRDEQIERPAGAGSSKNKVGHEQPKQL